MNPYMTKAQLRYIRKMEKEIRKSMGAMERGKWRFELKYHLKQLFFAMLEISFFK